MQTPGAPSLHPTDSATGDRKLAWDQHLGGGVGGGFRGMLKSARDLCSGPVVPKHGGSSGLPGETF